MTNRGKQFEDIIKKSFEKVPNVSIDRLHDQMNGYWGSKNISDFIVYKKPYEYYIECKSVNTHTLPFTNITDKQWSGMLEKSKIKGVIAGVICWYIQDDTTLFLPIGLLQNFKNLGKKSVRFDDVDTRIIHINGEKKRVFYDYAMDSFFHQIEKQNRR